MSIHLFNKTSKLLLQILYPQERGVAHNSSDIDEIHASGDPQDDNDPGVDEAQMGCGRASFLECLDRLGATTPATSASREGQRDVTSFHANPPQVVSPSLNQTPPQDPSPAHGVSREGTFLRTDDHKCKEEETPASESKEGQYDVKEEPESPRLEEEGTAQSSQPSQLPQE